MAAQSRTHYIRSLGWVGWQLGCARAGGAVSHWAWSSAAAEGRGGPGQASAGHAGHGPGVLWAWGDAVAVSRSVWEDASVFKVRGERGARGRSSTCQAR